jgi:hypothetical protein
MKYKKIRAYKYELAEITIADVPEVSDLNINHPYFSISNGKLVAVVGYAWDGASGPTIDDNTNLEPSLVHDVLYQAIREGLLPISRRDTCDRIFKRLCLEHGMASFRAEYYYLALKYFGESSAKKDESEMKIYEA